MTEQDTALDAVEMAATGSDVCLADARADVAAISAVVSAAAIGEG